MMKNKIIVLITLLLIVAGFVTANIEFDHSDDIIFQSPTEFNSDVNLAGANLQGFSSACANGETVTGLNEDGTVQCNVIEGPIAGLSEVLEQENVANQTIDMNDNRILDANYVNSNDINLTSSGDPILNYKAYEHPARGVFIRYNSQFQGDTSDNRLVLGTENAGNEYLVLTAEREGSELNLHRDVKIVDSDNFVVEQPDNPRVNLSLQEHEERGAFFRYDSNFSGDTNDNRAVIGTKENGNEYVVLTADRDGDWIDLERPFRDSVEIRRSVANNPVLDYNIQEGDDYGAFFRYDSSFSGDTSDNRLVIGTEDSGQDHKVLSAGRAGSFATLHRDTNIQGNLNVDGQINEKNVRDIGYSSGHTAWSSGLSDEEINRFGTGSGEKIEIERLDVQIKGGGTNSNFTVDVYDTGSGTELGSATAGNTVNDVGETLEGSDLIVRVTNSDVSQVEASITLSGQVVG